MQLSLRHTAKALALASAFHAYAALAANKPIPIESLARVPALDSITMSPDGEHLVGLVPSPKNPDETALATWDTNALSKGARVVTPSGDKMKFIDAYALKADKILVVGRQEWTGYVGFCGMEGNTAGATRTFISKTYLTGNDQKKFDEAFANKARHAGTNADVEVCLELGGSTALIDSLPLDPDKVVIQQLSEVSLSSSYYLYDLKSGRTELLFRADPRSTPTLFDHRTGKVLAKQQLEPHAGDYEQQVLLLDPQSGQYTVHAPLSAKVGERYNVEVVGIDDTSGKYYVLTDQFSDKVQARLYDPVQRKYDPEPLITDKDFSIGGIIFGTQPSNFNKVVGFVVLGAYPQAIYIDPTLKSIHDGLKQAFPDQIISLDRYTDDFSKVLVTVESGKQPPAYYLLKDKKDLIPIGSSRPWLDKSSIGENRWVTYTARDGLKIPALLSLPTGWKQGDPPPPAIIHPHGGPWARDYATWDASGWVPFLTSRGYAVLRPQYRGSADLGRELWLAGDREWGKKMSNDNDDGAAWLVTQGFAAKDRIAIFGYSYGGFAAVAATVRKPSPYQCAIAGAPVANLGRLGTAWSDNRLQRILQGKTVTGMDPMKNTADATLPVLLFVGDRDVRTPSFHAKDFYEAVKGTVPAKFELIADQQHSMPWYPRQQRQTLALIENFLKTDCGPGGL